MEKWADIRRRVLVEGTSRRQIQRETGLSWKTLEKILTHSSPPGYRRTVVVERLADGDLAPRHPTTRM